MRPQGQRGHDAEVPASAASARPVEVLVRVGVHVPDTAVGGDHSGGDQLVAREAEAPPGEPVAAAQRQPGNPDGRARSGRHGPPAACERALHVDQLRAGADSCSPA
jgi:hypothetical protein